MPCSPSPRPRTSAELSSPLFRGHDSSLRRQPTIASCRTGGHAIWWRVEADSEDHALALLPFFVTLVRTETKNGSNASASSSLSASTRHQMACPPVRQEAIVGCRRSELSWPRNEAKTTPHSSASCRW